MALGIRDEPLSIVEALNEARRRGIIVLASASNEGANDTIAFPARLDNVFCIGSADGKGVDQVSVLPLSEKRSTVLLEKAVLGAWPLPDDVDAEKYSCRRSGTSTAVAIAAGIVSTFNRLYSSVYGTGKRCRTIGITCGKYSSRCPRRQQKNLTVTFLQNIFLAPLKTSKVSSNPFSEDQLVILVPIHS